MKILYIKLHCGYSDTETYQENVLTTKFAQMGHETHIAVSTRTTDCNRKTIIQSPREYINEFGVHVHMLPFSKRFYRLSKKFDYFDTLYDLMERIHPDFIFSHGVQYASLLTVAKYKKCHPEVRLVADNHGDQVIMPVDNFKRKIVHKIIYKYFVTRADKYIDKYYGVSPSRGQYLTDIYGVSPNKIGIIPQVGDDTTANQYSYKEERELLCEKYHFDKQKSILIFGAGNIDAKKNLIPLVEAVEEDSNYELVVFGSFSADVQKVFEKHQEQPNIHYIGSLSGKDIYRTIIGADLAIYPGQHSVLWDNTVACGTPLCVRRWAGMDYFDVNGNCRYISEGTKKEIKGLLVDLSVDGKIETMRVSAQGNAKKLFSATEIAKLILNQTK